MIKKTTGLQIAAAIGMFAVAAIPAFAEMNIHVDANTNLPVGMGAPSMYDSKQEYDAQSREKQKMDNQENRGGDKIDLRLKSLQDLDGRINAMVKVSGTDKTSLTAAIQAQIDALTALKAKINTDTDPATLKADMQSITDSYRIFMVVEPKARIAAAADRALTIGTSFTTLSAKLQANVSTALAGGHDITAVNASLADMNAKVTDANAKANAAINLTANLQPDNGNATIAAANKTAIESARADIKTANEDLKTAYADAKSIVKALHDWNIIANASVKNQ